MFEKHLENIKYPTKEQKEKELWDISGNIKGKNINNKSINVDIKNSDKNNKSVLFK